MPLRRLPHWHLAILLQQRQLNQSDGLFAQSRAISLWRSDGDGTVKQSLTKEIVDGHHEPPNGRNSKGEGCRWQKLFSQ